MLGPPFSKCYHVDMEPRVSLPDYSLALLPDPPRWKRAMLKALGVLHKQHYPRNHSRLASVIKVKPSSIKLPLSEIFVTAIKKVTYTQLSQKPRGRFEGGPEFFSPVLSGFGMETRKKDL